MLAVCCLLAALLLVPVTGAGAAPARGCYPPPCGAALADGPAAISPDGAALIGLPAAGPDHRSPAPYVAVGLLMVTACLSTICVKRRMAMVSAAPPVRAPAPAARRQLERSLR